MPLAPRGLAAHAISMCKLHDDLLPRGDEPTLDTLARHVVYVVHDILQLVKENGSIHKVAHNAEKAAKQGKNVLWPTTPTDLLPYGADPSICRVSL
jgi:hypothetical protein